MRPALRGILRAPRLLYRHEMGWLLGHRFLQLRHRGRRTGLIHETVLEVVRWDPDDQSATVMSGFGPRADWLRNIHSNAEAHIDIGRDSFDASFRVLDDEEAARVFEAYERRNVALRPVIRLVLSRLLGWRYDGTPAARARLAAQLPTVEFRRIQE